MYFARNVNRIWLYLFSIQEEYIKKLHSKCSYNVLKTIFILKIWKRDKRLETSVCLCKLFFIVEEEQENVIILQPEGGSPTGRWKYCRGRKRFMTVFGNVFKAVSSRIIRYNLWYSYQTSCQNELPVFEPYILSHMFVCLNKPLQYTTAVKFYQHLRWIINSKQRNSFWLTFYRYYSLLKMPASGVNKDSKEI